MSGPAYRGGDGEDRGDGSDAVPRVPQQPGQPEQPERTEQPEQPGHDEQPEQREHPGRNGQPEPQGAPEQPGPPLDHDTLRSLLGAWALSACSREESRAVEVHLTECPACTEEGLRLRDAVRLLHQEESLDLDPLLRARVLEGCLGRRAARIPMPDWAGPYGAEAARLDALLRDLGDGYWTAPVELRWFDGAPVTRRFTVGQVIAHLTAVDSLVARALGLAAPGAAGPADPASGADGDAGGDAPAAAGRERAGRHGLGAAGTARFRSALTGADLPLDPGERTEAHWSAQRRRPGAELRSAWREQSLDLVRTVSFAGRAAGSLDVGYGGFSLPLRDAFLDRAFECWIHAGDIADAVDYPYAPPAPRALHQMIDLAARMLPSALAERRRAGLAASRPRLAAAGAQGRSLRLEIEGDGGGDWYVPVDSPGTVASEQDVVAHVAMDGVDFCQLAAGHVKPEDAAVGQSGDRAVIRDVLYAAASMSRI